MNEMKNIILMIKIPYFNFLVKNKDNFNNFSKIKMILMLILNIFQEKQLFTVNKLQDQNYQLKKMIK